MAATTSYQTYPKGPALAAWAAEEAEWWTRLADAEARTRLGGTLSPTSEEDTAC